MKKLFFTLALLGSLSGFAAQLEPNAVRINLKDATKITLAFANEPEITFNTSGLTITTLSQDPYIFEFDDIDYVDFEHLTAVDQIETNNLLFKATPQAIIIENAPDESTLAVYSLDGRTMLTTTFSGSYSIERNRLPKGIYIFKINKLTFKVSI